jgi:hypothetical protein
MTTGTRTDGRLRLAHLSTPSRSQEGGNEPSCRAISAEFDTVGPIPPGAAGGPLLTLPSVCADQEGGTPP